LCVDGFFDVADVGPVAKILVDEAVDVAQLHLDGGPDIVEAHDAGILADDLQAAFEFAVMVVGHFEHEKIFKNDAVHKGAMKILAKRTRRVRANCSTFLPRALTCRVTPA